MIFLGASAALIASSLIAVLAGDMVLKAVPLRVVRIATGTLFVVMGALLIVRSIR